MRELDERKIYEEEDEIDLMELFHTILKHKVKIVIVTIVVMLLSTLGGYIYNRLNSFNTAIIGFNYPELQKGKNPDGSIFLRTDIIPLDVINDTYNMYQEKLGGKKLDDFRNSIEVEGIIPDSTQTLIDNALKRGETLSFTASNYRIKIKEKDKEILNKLINDSISSYITKHKPNYIIQTIGDEIYNYDYSDSYILLDERLKMMEMAIASYENKNYISTKLGYSFGMISERIRNLKNVELKDYYSYYSINGLSKDSNNKLLRVDSEIQDLILENQALNGKVEVLDEMLHNFKPTQKQIVIPNIANEGVDIEDKNDYYSKLVEDYVALNNNIEDNKVKIQLLENSKVDIKAPSAEEIKNLDNKLRVVVEKANKIIEDINILSREYIDSTYSDMIKIVSPVTTDTEGKPLILFVGVGAVLGIMLGVFLAFMAEFIRNYRNKYSK